MGKCIGRRNMIWFQGFNACWVLYLVFVLLTTFSTLMNAQVELHPFVNSSVAAAGVARLVLRYD